jgi:hypothetical protein
VNAAVIENSAFCNEIDSRTPTSIALTPSPTPTPNPQPEPPNTRRALEYGQVLAEAWTNGDDKDKADVRSVFEHAKAVTKKYQAKRTPHKAPKP